MNNNSIQVHHSVRGLIEEKVNAAAATQAYNARTTSRTAKERYDTIRVQITVQLGRELAAKELVSFTFWPPSQLYEHLALPRFWCLLLSIM